MPIAHRLADGSTEDSTTHIATWDQLVAMLGTTDFLYTADCKLATRDNMEHIAGQGGRFLTILPRSRKEDEVGRAWIAAGEVYWAAETPGCSVKGFRIVWMRSSDKRSDDAARRFGRIEDARRRLVDLNETLSSTRCRMKTRASVDDAVATILKGCGSAGGSVQATPGMTPPA